MLHLALPEVGLKFSERVVNLRARQVDLVGEAVQHGHVELEAKYIELKPFEHTTDRIIKKDELPIAQSQIK